MARRALLVAIVAACAVPASALATGPNIYTVAGGGVTLPSNGGQATSASLDGPVSVSAGFGDSDFLALDRTCAPIGVFPDAGKDTGDIGYLGGIPAVPGSCTTGAAPPSNPGLP